MVLPDGRPKDMKMVNWCIVKQEKCLCMGKLLWIFQLQCLLVQSHYWADDHVAVLKQKSLWQAIMVSDFIEEETADYLLHNGREARLLLETQQDGYFDSDNSITSSLHVHWSRHPFCGISAKNQGNATTVMLFQFRPHNESVLAPTFGTCLSWGWAHPFVAVCSHILACFKSEILIMNQGFLYPCLSLRRFHCRVIHLLRSGTYIMHVKYIFGHVWML